jgi:hypothetical protein
MRIAASAVVVSITMTAPASAHENFDMVIVVLLIVSFLCFYHDQRKWGAVALGIALWPFLATGLAALAGVAAGLMALALLINEAYARTCYTTCTGFGNNRYCTTTCY